MINEIADGLALAPGYLDQSQQIAALEDIRKVVAAAPLYQPVMPRSGRPFSVKMSNCGPLGWISDKAGYRYQTAHPDTGQPWPDMPGSIARIWDDLSGYDAPAECCLINFYASGAKMGLHRDENEEDFSAPVVSVSLGDEALFRFGGSERKSPTKSVRLASGDVLIMAGASRLNYHGVDKIYPGTSSLLRGGGRLNLTLRRVTRQV
ncbi:MAG: alpha-ketoglutarate-dependent dioxygenase AlkB [Alphaproteobacteria bacterium]|nr:alpha-ketoglutarate-dependent dioxygenase AlkB [Alphaproteobacteria bacterium]